MEAGNAWTFHLPWKGRSYSGPLHVNLLAQFKNIYLMDNHRMALWCWAKHVNGSSPFSLFHLDAHYDCDPEAVARIDKATSWQSIAQSSPQEFMSIEGTDQGPLVKWDNYLPLFFKLHEIQSHKKILTTHKIGISTESDREIEPWDLARDLDKLLQNSNVPWIINLDFDYFYARTHKRSPLFAHDWIKRIFDIVYMNWADQRVAVITVALSPECCGGWDQATEILNIFSKVFSLPLTEL